MKILFVGNQGNTGFRFTNWLRRSGLDAYLLISKQLKHKRSLPENDFPELENNYPKWILQFNERKFPYLYPSAVLKKISGDFDIILTTGNYILPVLKLKKPVGFFPVGSDLTQLPYQTSPFINEIYSYLYRRRIGNVTRIFTVQKDCIWSARLLGQGNKVELFPFLVDTKAIKNGINYGLLSKLKNTFGHYDLIFFNPARKNMDPNKVNYKGSEKLLNAFKRFIKQTNSNVLLITGLHGDHANEFDSMVKGFNLRDRVKFTNHLSLPDLHAYMSLDNVVVFDQFTSNLNTLGGLQREALALGSIVVSSTDVHTTDFEKSYGPDCPLLPAFSEENILSRMKEVDALSRDDFYKKSYSAVEWAEKHIHWESRINELISALEDMVEVEY